MHIDPRRLPLLLTVQREGGIVAAGGRSSPLPQRCLSTDPQDGRRGRP